MLLRLVEVLRPVEVRIGFADTTDPIGREFGEFYSTPRGYHRNSITQFTMTSSMSFINLPLLSHIESISPRPILFVVGEHAHSRYFSEDAYALAQSRRSSTSSRTPATWICTT